MWTVYYHQNKINGKIYVGITSRDLKDRFGKDGCKYKHSIHFYAAIQKYGWENFEHEIFASNLTKEEAENMERILIKSFNLQNNKFGYNIEDGGTVTTGVHHDPELHKLLNKDKFKPVQCIEDGTVFECLSDAAKYYNLSRAAIRRSCQRHEDGKQRSYSHSGKHFKFIEHI